MNDEPVRPTHFHESAPAERRVVNSAVYLVLLAAMVALVVAALLGLN